MTYYAAKMSFIKRSLNFFTEEATKEPPIILAERAIATAPVHIESPRTFQQKRQVKGVIDFYIADVLNTEEGRLVAFKIGKKRIRPRGTLNEKKFGEVEEEHFPSSKVLWSAETQIVFIEKPKKDQMSVKSIINNLESYLNSRLLEYGYLVLIAQLPYKSSFWELIEKYDIKYSVEFVLFAPNFLDTSSESGKLVKDNKRDFAADKTSIKIASAEGHLHIPRGNKLIEDYLAWIYGGAGKWVAWVGIDNKKKSISSETNSKTLDKDLPEYNAKTAKDFTGKAIKFIDDEESDKGKNNE